MDVKKFLGSVKIPVLPIELRGSTEYVRALTTLDHQEALVIADKWAKDRAKEMGKSGIERIEVAFKDEGFESLKKYGMDTIAISSMLKAAMCLSDENGKPSLATLEEWHEFVFGEGALLESEVREILAIESRLHPESELKTEKEEIAKNLDTSGS